MLSLWNNKNTIKSAAVPDRSLSNRDVFGRWMEDLMSDLYEPYRAAFNSRSYDWQTNKDGSLSRSLDIPGVKEADLSVEVNNSFITVKGERKDERSSYSVNQSFSIPSGYNIDTLKAELSNGVLSLSLSPKSDQGIVVKKIEIKSV